MRTDAPSPDELNGGQFWVEAVFALDSEITLVATGGQLIWQADQFPTSQVASLVVPRMVDGVDVVETGVVGSDGHRLRLYGCSNQWPDRWPLGEFLVTRTVVSRNTVEVNAVDLTVLLVDHYGKTAVGVARRSRIRTIAERMCEADNIRLRVSHAVEGSPLVPGSFSIAKNRGDSFKELLTSWGVTVVPGRPNGLLVLPVAVDNAKVAATIREGRSGTLIDAPLHLDRSSIFNHVVVSAQDSKIVAEAYQEHGKYSVGRFGWRTRVVDLEAIESVEQARTVARTELAKSAYRAVTVPVECVPDWRLEPFDLVAVKSADVDGVGRVTGLDLPLAVGGSAVVHIGMEV